jgi:hypothetical protein
MFRLLLDRTDVRRLGALLALCDVELDGLTLGQRAVALAEDPGVVDEYVVPVLTGDKAEAFLVAEPLNGSAQCVSSFLCGAVRVAALGPTISRWLRVVIRKENGRGFIRGQNAFRRTSNSGLMVAHRPFPAPRPSAGLSI